MTRKPYVKQNPEFIRPAEVDILLGNPAKAEKILGWKCKVDFPGLVKMMVKHDVELESMVKLKLETPLFYYASLSQRLELLNQY